VKSRPHWRRTGMKTKKLFITNIDELCGYEFAHAFDAFGK
jgi:hypothetical protein